MGLENGRTLNCLHQAFPLNIQSFLVFKEHILLWFLSLSKGQTKINCKWNRGEMARERSRDLKQREIADPAGRPLDQRGIVRVDEYKEESNLISINDHICRTGKGRSKAQSLQRCLSYCLGKDLPEKDLSPPHKPCLSFIGPSGLRGPHLTRVSRPHSLGRSSLTIRIFFLFYIS